MVDRSVFQALEGALVGMTPTDPSTIPVRIHLAGLYLSAWARVDGLSWIVLPACSRMAIWA